MRTDVDRPGAVEVLVRNGLGRSGDLNADVRPRRIEAPERGRRGTHESPNGLGLGRIEHGPPRVEIAGEGLERGSVDISKCQAVAARREDSRSRGADAGRAAEDGYPRHRARTTSRKASKNAARNSRDFSAPL